MRFRFVEENRGAVPTERLCRIMNVSSRGFHAHHSRPISQNQRKDMVLLAQVRQASPVSGQLWPAQDDRGIERTGL